MPQLHVHNLPALVPAEQLAGSTVIVIDMLRASSTICYALANGAKAVVPLLEIEEALQLSEQLGREFVVLGGERRGGIIEGFDVGNSPSEYTPERVTGKLVLFTTTNGTRALAHAHEAERVLVGAAVNRERIIREVAKAERVDILCAGTDGEVTGEDILAAGSMVHDLCQRTDRDYHLNDSAAYAGGQWSLLVSKARLAGRAVSDELALALRETAGGKNLLEIGHYADLVTCAHVDSLDVLPELNRTTRQITLR
jgi:2-phosphosulfolactate phosphatase